MGHWYTKTAESKHTIVGVNGKERATTLRDARKLDLVPSVTSIIDIPAKPALVQWMQNQLLNAILKGHVGSFKVPKPPKKEIALSAVSGFEMWGDIAEYDFNDEKYLEKVKKWSGIIINKSKEISEKAAKRGSEIHDSLEKFYLMDLNHGNDEFILKAVSLLNTELKIVSNWVPEKSFYHELGFGGKVDLYHSDGIIVDFKTKDLDDFDKQLVYDNHCMQLAAYREGLGLPKAKCYNLFISTKKPGLVKLHEWTEEELQRGWEMFKALLTYWKLSNKF